MGSALEDLDLVAVGELDDRPLPVRLAPDVLAHPLVLPAVVRRPHPGHLDAEQRLDGLANLQLVGVGMHLEVVLPAVLIGDRARFRDERPHDRAMKRRHRSTSPSWWTSSRPSSWRPPSWREPSSTS